MKYYLIRKAEHGYDLINLENGECVRFKHRQSAIDYSISNLYDNAIDGDTTILQECRHANIYAPYFCNYYIIDNIVDAFSGLSYFKITQIGVNNNSFIFDRYDDLERFANNNDILLCEPLEERYYSHFLL